MPNAFDDLFTAQTAAAPKNAFDDLFPSAPQEGVTSDVIKSAGTGLVKGTGSLLGSGGDFQTLAQAGANKLMSWAPEMPDWLKSLDTPEAQRLAARHGGRSDQGAVNNPLPGSDSVNQTIEGVTGPLHTPTTTAGKYAENAAEFVPGAMLGPGGIARKAIQYGVIPGLASEAAGEAAQKYAPNWETPARIGAAIASPGTFRRAVTPFPTTSERSQAVDLLKSQGIFPSAGQQSGNTGLRYAESFLADVPFASERAGQIKENNLSAFTNAMLNKAGMSGTATPDVMKQGLQNINNEYNRLTSTYNMGFSGAPGAPSSTIGELASHVGDYESKVNKFHQSPVPRQIMETISQWGADNGGFLQGKQYQTLRSQLRSDAMKTTDPYLSNTLHNMTNTLDDAMKSSIAKVNPADANAFELNNQKYKNYLTLEKAVSGAGVDGDQSLISPARMRSAVVGQEGKRASNLAEGDFTPTVRAANLIMHPLPNSGTAQREHIMNTVGNIMSLLGGGVGVATGGGLEGGVFGSLMGHGVPAAASVVGFPAASKFLFSDLMQGNKSGSRRGYLTNQIIPSMANPQSEQDANRLMMVRALLEGAKPRALPPPNQGQSQ